MNQRLLPMLAVASAPFDSAEYLFEVKWDGVRALAAGGPGGWSVWGRDGADYSARYPELAVLGRLPAGTVLDGELVRWGPEGLSNLGALLKRHHLTHPGRIAQASQSQPVCYVVFSQGVVGAGRAFFDAVVAQGQEGMMAKHLVSS